LWPAFSTAILVLHIFRFKFPRPVWGFQMSSFPESLLDDMRNTRLALIAEAACDFKAQMLDLIKLRDQVRKAEQTDPSPHISFPTARRRYVSD
jgi:hypothetical protein